ncbi:hypothetical protein HJC23_006736 [Cyclotella cryptica]|uniref:EF-hand domain-containing protein n=1 Tax=Cyclotella cryptica TaxID=29204 RepID=A0ABD3PNJ4_9STRA
MKSKPKFEDAGEARRRALLVSKLSRRHHEEFTELFKIIDETNDGLILLLELRRAMESIGGKAEFYYLFMDTFEMLDVQKTGYVSAGSLDRALCRVRDLISDDRMSIIDTEDMDMQIDYKTFADMLLGKPL